MKIDEPNLPKIELEPDDSFMTGYRAKLFYL